MNTASFENCLAFKHLSLLTAFMLGAQLAGAQCDPPPSGLVAWWPGEGSPNDIVNANGGTPMGAVTFAAGRVGMAFDFDGSSGFINVANNSSMDFGTNDFTIAGWIRLSTLDGGPGGGREIIHKSVGSVPANNNYTYFLEYDGGPPSLRFRVSDPFSANDLVLAAPLVVGTWFHVAAVRIGNANRIYLNGSLLGQQVAGDNIDTGTGGVAYIGNIAPNGVAISRFFPGQIDELSLWKRALSENEVEAIYAAGSAGMCRKPIILLPQNFTASAPYSNQLALQFSGTPNYPYILQATTNLTPPIIWQGVLTNQTDTNGHWTTVLTNLQSVPFQFFRAEGQ